MGFSEFWFEVKRGNTMVASGPAESKEIGISKCQAYEGQANIFRVFPPSGWQAVYEKRVSIREVTK